MARRNGCPCFFRDWSIHILSRNSTEGNENWLPVRGLESFELQLEAETEDFSGAESLWSEPCVTKRSGKLTLKGRPLADPSTGESDPGLGELRCYAALGGCCPDARLRLADPFGRAQVIDVVVTEMESGADGEGEALRFDCEIVGAPEEIPYVQLRGMGLDSTQITLDALQRAEIVVNFEPVNASNRKFGVFCDNPGVLDVRAGESSLLLTALSPGQAQVTLRSMNNGHSCSLAVTVN